MTGTVHSSSVSERPKLNPEFWFSEASNSSELVITAWSSVQLAGVIQSWADCKKRGLWFYRNLPPSASQRALQPLMLEEDDGIYDADTGGESKESQALDLEITEGVC